MMHSDSPKTSQRSGRQRSDDNRTGTGCQLCDFIFAGVLWSPVMINTSGLSYVILGMIASSSSVRCTLAGKLPSSPVESVYLKWTKKKS